MGNSRTDKSKEFIKSGMTLITQVESDKLLKKAKEKKKYKTHWVCTKCGGKGCEHCNKGWEK